MREILFCGNRTDNGKRVVGFYHYTNWYNPITKEIVDTKHWILPVGCQEAFQVDPETVGQYTGLRDSKRTAEHPNGQRIFEGDIVNVEYNVQYVGVAAERRGLFVVVFDDGCFMKRNKKGLFHFIPSDKCEVIGNIHDNPELLQTEKE